MPTLFILFSMRFCFYTEDHEPVHVHVIAHGIEAKFNLDPEITLVSNNGLTTREIRLAKELIEENEEVIRERWKAIFYPDKKDNLHRKEEPMTTYEVWLDNENIYVRNEAGEVASKPIGRYQRLLQATEEQRKAFELSSCGIHWYALDIDLEFESFFHPQKYTLLACCET